MDRIVIGATGTISATLAADDTPADASGTVTVAGVGLDGSTLFSGNADPGTAGDGIYTYTVDPADTTQPDIVTATWSGTWGSVAQTVRSQVAIVGDHYFTIAQLRAWEPSLSSTSAYPAEALRRARAWAETRAEAIMRRSFVRSVDKMAITCTGEPAVALRRRDTRSVRSITLNGVAQTVSDYTLRSRVDAPLLHGAWPADANAVIIYEHGAEWVRDDVARAVAVLTRNYATRHVSSIPDRAERWQPAESGGMFQLSMPSNKRTGIPEVDAVLLSVRGVVFA